MIITTITLNKCFYMGIPMNLIFLPCVCVSVFVYFATHFIKFINFYPMCDVLKNNLTNIVQLSVNVIKKKE